MSLKSVIQLINTGTAERNTAAEFLDALNDFIRHENNKNHRKPSKTLKPSSLGGCIRNIYYQLVGVEPDEAADIGPEIIGMGESGTDRHARIQDYIQKMPCVEWVDVGEYVKSLKGVTVQGKHGNEYKLYCEKYNMSFMCDGVIKFNDDIYILEIKTETRRKWEERKGPEQSHTVQAMAYSAVLGIKNVIFLYENRDVCSKKAYLYKVTEEDLQWFDSYVAEIFEYVQSQTVPARTADTRNCYYCRYKSTCRVHG